MIMTRALIDALTADFSGFSAGLCRRLDTGHLIMLGMTKSADHETWKPIGSVLRSVLGGLAAQRNKIAATRPNDRVAAGPPGAVCPEAEMGATRRAGENTRRASAAITLGGSERGSTSEFEIATGMVPAGGRVAGPAHRPHAHNAGPAVFPSQGNHADTARAKALSPPCVAT